MRAEVIVCGLGPSGRAVAHRAVARGLSVIAIDPAPERTWVSTYGAWADELPGWLEPGVVAASVAGPVAWAVGEHRLDRVYQVFDSARLRASLSLDGATVLAERAVAVDARAGVVRTASGIDCVGRVVDARGLGRSPRRAEQTAYGVVLARADEPTLFMDWRLDNGADPAEPPSFLYAVPLGPDTVLFEETCLAGRPALAPDVLRRRLEHRLSERGIALTGTEPVERVRFPVQGGTPGEGRIGAAGGWTHPATGYSVATSLAAADTVVVGAPWWTPRTRAVSALRRAGLRALLALPPRDVPVFFDTFFDLPTPLQRAYLSGHDDLRGTLTAMRTLFTAAPTSIRRTLASSVLGLS